MNTSQNIFRTIAGIFLATGLMGCHANVDSSAIPNIPVPVTPPTNNATSGMSLEGLWKTDCVLAPGSNVYTIQSAEFTGDKMKTVGDIYMDSACQQKFQGVPTSESNGTFKVGDKSSAVANAYNVDYTLTDVGSNSTETFYDTVLIENNVMYLGAAKGMNPASRPAEVDRTLGFKKK